MHWGPRADPFASGAEHGLDELAPGTVRELTIARFGAPDVAAPRGCQLRATVTVGDMTSSNAWPLWVFPRALWSGVERVTIVDPHGCLDDLVPLLGERVVAAGAADVVVATEWTPEAADFVDRGGSAVLLQPDRAGPLPAEPLPFWREAIRVAAAHPAWGDFPVEPFIGLQLMGASADHAFDTSDRPDRFPILRRVDARTGRVHDYAAELRHGRGRLIASTLRSTAGPGTCRWASPGVRARSICSAAGCGTCQLIARRYPGNQPTLGPGTPPTFEAASTLFRSTLAAESCWRA